MLITLYLLKRYHLFCHEMLGFLQFIMVKDTSNSKLILALRTPLRRDERRAIKCLLLNLMSRQLLHINNRFLCSVCPPLIIQLISTRTQTLKANCNKEKVV